jgi:hypothetical protein
MSGGLISKSDMLVDVDGKPQSLRWVEMQMDDLDIDMALQRLEEAVTRIEKLRRVVRGMRGNPTTHDVFNARLDERSSKLAGVITKYLADTHSWLTVTQKNVDWLVRLGFEDRAREAYLEARSQVILKRIRYAPFYDRPRYTPSNFSQTSDFRRRPPPLHLPNILHLLYHNQRHRPDLPVLLPDGHVVRLRQVGQRAR